MKTIKNKSIYSSPFGDIMILVIDSYLVELYFISLSNSKYNLDEFEFSNSDLTIKNTRNFLDNYFNGKPSNINDIKIKIKGSTFYKNVINYVINIPFGKTVSYSDVAKELQTIYNYKKPPYQAVGMSLKKNNIIILIPCHRVIGKNNKLIGYNQGISMKQKLLNFENPNITYYH